MGVTAKEIMKRVWPIFCIVILWLFFSSPYVIKGLVPFPSDYLVSFFPPWNSEFGMPVKNNAMPDVITQIFPWKKLTIETWKSGAIPLWNPYSFSGTPHGANYQSAIFSPLNVLFFFLPFLDAWSVMVLLQPFFAGLGLYFLLRSRARSQIGSLIGAVGFMFCGFMSTWMAYGTLGWAIAALPWALWAIETKRNILLALSIAFSFLSGHFQISLYMVFTVIAYILYVRRLSSLFFVFLGILFAAPQLLLTFLAYLDSNRGVSIGKIEVIPWRYLITIVFPDFFGNPVTRNDWFGHYAEWASFVGIVPLLFGLFAVLKRVKDGRIFFVLLGVVTLLFAFPSPLNDLLYWLRIPILSTSANSRIIVLLSFSLASLSAFGLDDLVRSWKERNIKRYVWFAAVVFCMIGLFWFLLSTGHLVPAERLIVSKRNAILPTVLIGVLLFCVLVGFVRKKYVQWFAFIILLLVTTFDSYRYVQKWMPFSQRANIYPQVKSATFLQDTIGYNRVFGNIGNEFSGIFKIPIIEGYDAMYKDRYARFIKAASTGFASGGDRSIVQFDKHGKYKTDVLKLLGVRYFYHRMSDGRNSWAFPYWEYQEKGNMKIIYNDEKYQVFEYTDAYPRVFLASGYKVTNDDWDIFHTLFDPAFNSRETVILEQKPDREPAVGSGSAEIRSYTPTTVEVVTSSDVNKLLFLSDVFDPGWQVRIDGKKAPLYRADYIFRAVSVPAGTHTIHFTYTPTTFIYGILLSAIATILGIVVIFWQKK